MGDAVGSTSGCNITVEKVKGMVRTSSSRKAKYEIRSDFKAATYDNDGAHDEIHARYVINGGGELIMLETVNGYIDIKKK